MSVAATDAWREPFERALDADPSNQAIRRDLADHLEERGDPDAEAVRWLADHGRWPFWNSDLECWDWFARNDSLNEGEDAEVDTTLFQRLSVWRDRPGYSQRRGAYPTRRAAEADFCRAFREAKAGWDPGAT